VQTRFVAFILFASGIVGGQGFRMAPPPPPRSISIAPQRPGAEYVWIEGYWYPSDGEYSWHAAYWTRPPYANARWVAPRHDGERFHDGYWEGDRGRRDHDHRWDRHRDRDYHGRDRD
jgi:hypothetical protein